MPPATGKLGRAVSQHLEPSAQVYSSSLYSTVNQSEKKGLTGGADGGGGGVAPRGGGGGGRGGGGGGGTGMCHGVDVSCL